MKAMITVVTTITTTMQVTVTKKATVTKKVTVMKKVVMMMMVLKVELWAIAILMEPSMQTMMRKNSSMTLILGLTQLLSRHKPSWC